MKKIVFFLSIFLLLVMGTGVFAQNIVEDDSVAVVTIELKEPKTKSDQDFIAVRNKMNGIRDIFRGVEIQADTVRQHPRAGVSCNSCHTSDKITKDHNMAIDETNPSASCVGCHNLEKAAKMPFYVKAYTSLNDPANLPKAEKLIESASGFKNNLKNNLSGLPETNEVKLIAELAGKGQQKTIDEPNRFTHALKTDLVPFEAIEVLADKVLQLSEDVAEKTKLEVKLEGKVERARGLAKHLVLQDTLADILGDDGEPQVIELDIKDEYRPPLPLDPSLDLLKSLVYDRFPEAMVTKDETKNNERKYEWEIPGNPKTEIKFEWKNNDRTKIEFKKLLPSNETKAILILDAIQDEYRENRADREIKTKFETKEKLLKETKIELKYKPFSLPMEAIDYLESQVDDLLPEAGLKERKERKIEWEIPGEPKGEIKAEIKDNETKIEFKNVDTSLHSAAILILARVQEAYDIPNEFSKYEFKFEAGNAEQKAELIAALGKIQEPSPSGDFLFELKHKADSKGTQPTADELSGLAGDYATINQEVIRLINNEIKFDKDLKVKEFKTKVISAHMPSPVELAEEIIISIKELNLPKAVEQSYMANLKKVGTFISDGKITPAINQLNAFISKVKSDIAKKRINKADGNELIRMGTDLVTILESEREKTA